ncbi:MAG: hypothetical protein ACYDBW_08605 [Sulfuricaulis sp.]
MPATDAAWDGPISFPVSPAAAVAAGAGIGFAVLLAVSWEVVAHPAVARSKATDRTWFLLLFQSMWINSRVKVVERQPVEEHILSKFNDPPLV